MLKKQRNVYVALIAMALSLVLVFGIWWFNPTHIPNNFSGANRIFDILFFLIVSYVVWHPIVMSILSWAIASHIKRTPKKMPAKNSKVAFVTTFVPGSESIDLLHKTLPAMLNAKYPHDTWLLDEGNDPLAKKLCKQLGVKYFSRFGQAIYNTDGGKFAKKPREVTTTHGMTHTVITMTLWLK